jgi:tetratricopeptide (TPR) repeat protein
VAELCRRLDGIPLALELAAAWTRLLSVEQLALRLDDRFRLLTGGSRTALPRQQTLRAAFDWSYELLGERERQLFGRLAVFAGGFTPEAAEAVCAGDGIERADVLALLARLVDTSLVQTDERPDGDTRYRLLETVRQYARERLHLEGSRSVEDAVVALRHAEYFLGIGEHAIQQADPGPGISTWKPGRLAGAIEADRDNLHGALLWLEGQPNIERALRLARPLAHYWYARGLAGEGNVRLQRLFSLATASTSLEALTKTRLYLASFARVQGDYTTARAHLEALEAQSRRSGDRTLLALVLADLGLVLREEDALPAARARAEEGLCLWRELGDERHAAVALERLGSIAELQGDAAEARRCYEHFYQVARTHGARMEMGWALHELALLALGQGDAAAAKPPLRAGMETFQQLNYPLGLVWTLPLFACLAAMERRAERALRLAGALEAISTQAGLRLYRRQRHLLERWLPVACSTLGEEMAAAASIGGRALSLEQAVACALEEDGDA